MDGTKAVVAQILEKEKPAIAQMHPAEKLLYGRGYTMGQVAMAGEVERLMHERDTWQYEATHDDLTGLLNRRGMLLEFQAAIDKHKHPENLAVAAFDLDKFKNFNDSHGHEGGNDLLKFFGYFLRSHLRREDEVVAHLSGRAGGDEFLALLDLSPGDDDDPRAGPDLRAISFEQWLRHGFEQELLLANPDFQESGGFSIGIAFHKKGRGLEAAFREADAKMYEQKKARGLSR